MQTSAKPIHVLGTLRGQKCLQCFDKFYGANSKRRCYGVISLVAEFMVSAVDQSLRCCDVIESANRKRRCSVHPRGMLLDHTYADVKPTCMGSNNRGAAKVFSRTDTVHDNPDQPILKVFSRRAILACLW